WRKASTTDDHGAYRLDSLAAGDYLVGISNQIYYPAARKLGDAGILQLAAGESLELNFTLPPVTMTRVSGTLARPLNVKVGPTLVRLVGVTDPPFAFSAGVVTLGSDAAFSFDNVPPGTYHVLAKAADAIASGAAGTP